MDDNHTSTCAASRDQTGGAETTQPSKTCETCKEIIQDLARCLDGALPSILADLKGGAIIQAGEIPGWQRFNPGTPGVPGCHFCTLLWQDVEHASHDGHRHRNGRYTHESCPVIQYELISGSSVSGVVFLQVLLSVKLPPPSESSPSTPTITLYLELEKDQCRASDQDHTASSPGPSTSPNISHCRGHEKIQPHHLATSTSSEETLCQARRWIQECLDTHKKCKIGNRVAEYSHKLPTRLIDVSSGTNALRLHRTGEPRSTAWDRTDSEFEESERLAQYDTEYVALSHSWGGANFLKLTSLTYVAFRDEFRLDDLPRTWRDAIQLTRLLGYRFIWIDALCIIQDSNDDWETEADLMATVYGNCHLNIAALGGATSEHGLFHDRCPLLFVPCDVTPLFSSTSCFTGSGYRVVGACASRFPTPQSGGSPVLAGDYGTAMKSEPLNTRGWVVQERALSPRTLYYGNCGIFWDCLTTEADEFSCLLTPQLDRQPSTSWETLNLKKALHRGDRSKSSKPGQVLGPSHGRKPRGVRENGWRAVLEVYCRTNLTFEKDRLIAAGGMARYIYQSTGDYYVAGLWERSLPGDLLWCVKSPVDSSSSSSSENMFSQSATAAASLSAIPSFSWASLGHPAEIYWPHVEDLATSSPDITVVYECRIKSASAIAPMRLPYNPTDRFGGSPPMGLVQSASITLDGLIRRGTSSPSQNNEDWITTLSDLLRDSKEAGAISPAWNHQSTCSSEGGIPAPAGVVANVEFFFDRASYAAGFRTPLLAFLRDGVVTEYGLIVLGTAESWSSFPTTTGTETWNCSRRGMYRESYTATAAKNKMREDYVNVEIRLH